MLDKYELLYEISKRQSGCRIGILTESAALRFYELSREIKELLSRYPSLAYSLKIAASTTHCKQRTYYYLGPQTWVEYAGTPFKVYRSDGRQSENDVKGTWLIIKKGDGVEIENARSDILRQYNIRNADYARCPFEQRVPIVRFNFVESEIQQGE